VPVNLADKIVTWLAYRISSKAERERHLKDLNFHLTQNANLLEIMEKRLSEILTAPLREREKQPDYMAANTEKMRSVIVEIKENGCRLRERIEIIHPTFPKAQARRTR
jgi:hypothetical protein